MEEETKRIIRNIRKIRRAQKISQFDFALELGIAPSHLYYIESQKVIPSIDVVIKMAKALKVSLVKLAKQRL